MGAGQVRGSGRAGGTCGPRWGRVSRHCLTISAHSAALTDNSKSQLALHYAHSVRDASPQTFVFWVHASTRARFEEAYIDIADRLRLPGRSDPKTNVLRLVSNWLRVEENGQWLMVVDSADDVEIFFPSHTRSQRDKANVNTQISLAAYLPQGRNGAVLVTSRSRDAAAALVGGYNKTKEVLAMNAGEGLQLLHNKLRDLPTKEDAVELLNELNYIPLAITQAAAYIDRRARMTVTRYLDEFQNNSRKQERLLSWDVNELRRDASASNSVVKTWQISFEQIRRERRSAAGLLSLMSFFNPQKIPESLLRQYNKRAVAASDAQNDKNGEEADHGFEEDLDILQAYSLISMTANSESCEMHALVQFCTRVWLSSSSDAEQWERRFLVLIATELPNGEYKNWATCQQLLPHLVPLFDRMPAAEEALKAWAQVLTHASWYLWKQGSYIIAEEIAAKALAVREKTLGLDNQQTLSTLGMLALVLRSRGKYTEAEALNRRVLAGLENKLGKQHPSTLMLVSNLAEDQRARGKYEEAEALNRHALAGRRMELGEHHLDTLSSMGSLALVLLARGKYKEAEKLNQQSLAGYKKELGEHHPDTLTSISNLALVLQYQSKYKEAEMLNQQALEGRKKTLGEKHPDTLTSLSNLGLVLLYQGEYGQAEILNRQSLEGRKKVLGEQHPTTLTSLSNLAGVMQHQGKLKEAEMFTRQVLDSRRRELGCEHPDTLTSISILAGVMLYQGRFKEAEILHWQALAGRTKELGEHHPDTLNSACCLAELFHTLHRFTEATVLYRQACNGRIKQLGPEHPLTIACCDRFAAMQQEEQQVMLSGE